MSQRMDGLGHVKFGHYGGGWGTNFSSSGALLDVGVVFGGAIWVEDVGGEGLVEGGEVGVVAEDGVIDEGKHGNCGGGEMVMMG